MSDRVTGGFLRDDASGALVVRGDEPTLLASVTKAWANSAPAGTENTVDLDPGSAHGGRLLAVIVRNPSTVTALTLKLQQRYTDPNGGATRYADASNAAGVSTFTVLANNADGQVYLVDGGLVGLGRLSLKNATVLGGADGFTASVQVYALCAI